MGTLLDTNVLVLFAKNIDTRLLDNPFTLDVCMKELEHLAKKNSAAKLALNIVKEKNIPVVKSNLNPADDAIIRYAGKEGCKVATNDTELIKKLKNAGIRVLRLRQGKYFADE